MLRVGLGVVVGMIAGLGTWGVTDPGVRLKAELILHKMVRPFHRMTGRLVRNPLGMEFVRIPAGRFTMGSDVENRKAFQWGPAHRVTLTRPFLMQATEVTVAQFRTFVEATSYRTEAETGNGILLFRGGKQWMQTGTNTWEYRADANWRNPYFQQNDDHPVVGLSWNDTQAYLAWLNQKDPGRGYRLPTEAEWEYACRAGTTGDTYGPLDEIAWYEGNSGFHTHPVATKRPNAFGLFDMFGNAAEWCQDWYASPYLPGPVSDPSGPRIGNTRILRGCSWVADPINIRAYVRGADPMDARRDTVGFRVVASSPEP